MNAPKRFHWAVSVLVFVVLCVVVVGIERGDSTWQVVLGNNGRLTVIERDWWGFGRQKMHHLRPTQEGWKWSADMDTWTPVPDKIASGISGAKPMPVN